LADFKAGKVRVLVATDIAARGIDIQQLPSVVNYELPNVSEDYVHRIGRTGRAGEKGQAVSLVCIDERKLLADIENLLKRRIDTRVLPGFEVDPSIRAEPPKRNGGGGHGGGGRARQGSRNGGGGGGPRSGGGGGPRNGGGGGAKPRRRQPTR
jgi:ATP-dependent RNA helicase RhlE